jgi:hypothetical protein
MGGLGLTIAVFLGSLSLVSLTSAQTVATPPAAGTAKHAVMESLRQAHRLLVEADHDYDGHRAKAAEAVHRAIRELEGKHHGKKVQSGSVAGAAAGAGAVISKPAKVKQPAVHEAQANSDAQLHQAQAILQQVQTELNSHHPKAAAHTTEAITEITTALSIK